MQNPPLGRDLIGCLVYENYTKKTTCCSS